MKEIIIRENDSGQRLDKFLQKAFPDLPQSLAFKYIRIKRIKVNGKRAANNQKLEVGDKIQLYVNDEFISAETEETPLFLKAPSIINSVYEDENIILLNKKPGLLCHEDASEKRDTLINRLLHFLYEKNEFDYKNELSFTPALCNRIDRNTQGIVIAAKNAAALRDICDMIKNRTIEKKYLCIVHGTLPKSHDILKGYHTKDDNTNTVRITSERRDGAKTAITEYSVVAEKNNLSLLKVSLHTGRTHQIRAHLAAIGHPLLGDTKYGTLKQNQPYNRKFQALCSYYVKFGNFDKNSRLYYLSQKEFAINPADIDFIKDYFNVTAI